MKYTDRELRMFNMFSLLLLLIGGIALTIGLLEFAFMPEVEYYSSVKTRADPAIQQYSIEAVTNSGKRFVQDEEQDVAVSDDESTFDEDNSLVVDKEFTAGSAAVDSVKKRQKFVYETVRRKETNLGAMSGVLTGVVFIVLSVALNSVISHVKRHGGADTVRGKKGNR